MYRPPIDGLDGPNILALYEEGLYLSDIARATGRSLTRVHTFLKKQEGYIPRRRVEIKRRPRFTYTHLTDEERGRMVALYADGQNITRIAKATRRNDKTVRLVLIAAGVYDAARQAAARPERPDNHPWRIDARKSYEEWRSKHE